MKAKVKKASKAKEQAPEWYFVECERLDAMTNEELLTAAFQAFRDAGQDNGPSRVDDMAGAAEAVLRQRLAWWLQGGKRW